MDDLPALLDADTVAQLVGFGTRTLWRLVRSGKFPQPIRFNRKLVKWPLVVVEEWLARFGATLARCPAPVRLEPPPDPKLPADLIPAKIAAKLLGTHVSTIYRWVLSRQLTGYRRGTARFLVSRSAVLAQVREVEPAAV